MARTTQTNATTSAPNQCLYVALELSKKTWKLGFATSRTGKVRVRNVEARNLPELLVEITRAKRAFNLPEDVPVKACYEAGRDGFWIQRALEARGIENVIFESSSILVDRRARQAKTDRLDVEGLVRLLVRHHDGEDVVRVVRVPPPEAEDERVLPRRLKRLKQARTDTTNAIRAALMLHGVDLNPRRKSFLAKLKDARQWNGEPLPPGQLEEIELLHEHLVLVESQIKTLDKRQKKTLEGIAAGETPRTAGDEKAALLWELRGIGHTSAYVLSTEFFSWREFANRGEVGALAGLTGMPFSSGSVNRDQGISKAGNTRVRALMVELAWLWVRLQPESTLTRWYHDYVGRGGGRGKRKAIVALARKLLVAFWHYVDHGVVPEGAVLKCDVEAARKAA